MKKTRSKVCNKKIKKHQCIEKENRKVCPSTKPLTLQLCLCNIITVLQDEFFGVGVAFNARNFGVGITLCALFESCSTSGSKAIFC